MQRRSVPRTDPRYNQVRSRNNDSVKKSRDKARRERDETMQSIDELEDENQQLTERVQILKQEYEQLQELFKQHTGLSMDQLLTSETKSAADSSPSTSSSVQPKIIEPPKEIPAKPVLTINTNEDKTASTSDVELDATSLDGAIVIINGVQYKIFSINKT